MKTRCVWRWAVGLMALTLAACGPDDASDEVQLRLTSFERTRIDSLFEQEVQVLRPVLDSLCEVQYPRMVQQAVDSIVQERLEDEARLRARIPLNQ